MIALALEAIAASALLMLLVLAARGPVRQAFGARVAYALWALPALRLVLPPMPETWNAPAPLSQMGPQALVLIVPTAGVGPSPAASGAAAQVAAAAPVDWSLILALLWGAGMLAVLGWQLSHYLWFSRRVLREATPLGQVGKITLIESAAASGPLAFGVLRPVVAFPRDFAARYDADEQELALAHELGHHRRGDLWANWIALGVLALHWFNPVVWIAYRAFRSDQEMANDAGVLARRSPAARHAYGCAIVKAAHGRAITPACHLNTVKDLKGRLRMLGRGGVSQGRVVIGVAATTALTLGGLAVTASGTPAAASMRAKVEDATGVRLADIAPAASAARATTTSTWTTSTSDQSDADEKRGARTDETKRTRRVVIVKDGERTVYEGEAADAYVAAHPVPVPPVPPIPPVPEAPLPPAPGAVPVPPTPPVPPAVVMLRRPATGTWGKPVRIFVPSVSERTCRDGVDGDAGQTVVHHGSGERRVTVVCSNRIQRMADVAAMQAMNAERLRASAMRGALASLMATRASLAANPNLTDNARSGALEGIDQSIAEMRAEIASND